jgi:hypothetical protein
LWAQLSAKYDAEREAYEASDEGKEARERFNWVMARQMVLRESGVQPGEARDRASAEWAEARAEMDTEVEAEVEVWAPELMSPRLDRRPFPVVDAAPIIFNREEWDAMPKGSPKIEGSKIYYVTHRRRAELKPFQALFMDNWKKDQKSRKSVKKMVGVAWRVVGSTMVFFFINHATSHLLRFFYGKHCMPGFSDFFDSIFYKHLSPICKAITLGMSATETNMFNIAAGSVAFKMFFPNNKIFT